MDQTRGRRREWPRRAGFRSLADSQVRLRYSPKKQRRVPEIQRRKFRRRSSSSTIGWRINEPAAPKCVSFSKTLNRNTHGKQLLAAVKRGRAELLTKDNCLCGSVVELRIPQADPDLARKQAEEEGLPYQTYIKSFLHETLVDSNRGPRETKYRSLPAGRGRSLAGTGFDSRSRFW